MHISNEPLDILGALKNAQHDEAGAVVLFSGDVRNHNKGKAVTHLYYETYEEMANDVIAEILAKATERWDLQHASCVHRIGEVGIGESAVVVATASVHRQAAYEANQFIIDMVKHKAPVWKREHYLDGTHKWGNNCNCATSEHELAYAFK
jgi:molybdopterin synthase catalytic subunit